MPELKQQINQILDHSLTIISTHILPAQPPYKQEHHPLAQILLHYIPLVDQPNNDKHTLLSSDPHQLIIISSKEGAVGEEGEVGILGVAEYFYEGGVGGWLGDFHQEGLQ